MSTVVKSPPSTYMFPCNVCDFSKHSRKGTIHWLFVCLDFRIGLFVRGESDGVLA